jgi:hypothetical protein
MSEELKADKLVKVFVKIRDAREALARKYEEEDGALKEQQETIKSELLEKCKTIGADSLKTQFGTATRTIKTRYWSADWQAMHIFCKEHDALDLLERRVSQGNMKTFLKEHPDIKIPGLNSDSAYDITVRRSK